MNQRELYFFLKFASKEGFLNKLRGLGTDSEILNYAEGLEEKYLGVVVGAVVKNRGISLNEVQELVAAKERVEKLKSKDKESIEAELPSDLDPGIKNWAIIQIKKGKKDLLLNNLNQIVKFVKEYEIDLASYDVDSLLREIGRVTEFGNNKDEVNNYLIKVVEYANRKFAEVNNPILVGWAKRKLLNVIKELENNIRKSLNETVSFQDLLADAHQIKENMDAGMYRGQEIPHTPLRHREYDALVSNIEFLDDWHKALSPDLSSKSIDNAIEESNQWHKDVANSGIGLQYTPINRSDIVFGPEGWENPENNGHIILELKNENDLKVEGAKQNHCVGGYGEKIKNNQCRIFSLRNVNNIYQPILTIETDTSGAVIRQDYGPGNSKIEQKYHDMVTEWSSQNTLDISKLNMHDKIKLAGTTDNQKTLELLAKDSDKRVKCAVAINLNTNEKILEELFQENDDNLKVWIARNPNTNEKMLEELAKYDNKDIKFAVVQNPNTNEKTLEELAKCNDQKLKINIIRNPKVNEKVLEELAKNNYDSSYIIELITEHPKTNGKTLELLAQDQNLKIVAEKFDAPRRTIKIKINIAKHRNVNEKTLEKLVEGIIYQSTIGDYNEGIIEAVLKNPNINEKILEILAKDKNRFTVEAVARHPKTNQKTLKLLAKDKNLKYVVARNPNTNEKMLEELLASNYNDINMRLAVSENRNTNEKTLELLALAQNNELRVLSNILMHPNINRKILLAVEEGFKRLEGQPKQASNNSKIIKVSKIVNLFHKIVKSGEI